MVFGDSLTKAGRLVDVQSRKMCRVHDSAIPGRHLPQQLHELRRHVIGDEYSFPLLFSREFLANHARNLYKLTSLGEEHQ